MTMTRREAARSLFDSVYRMYGDPGRWATTTRSRLKRHGISQGKLAKRAGIDPSHLSKWVGERRTTRPSIENMLLVDEALFELIELVAGTEAVESELNGVIAP